MKLNLEMNHRDQPIQVYLNGKLATEIIASNCCEDSRDWEKELEQARCSVSFAKWAQAVVTELQADPKPEFALAFLRGLSVENSHKLQLSFAGVAYPGHLDYPPASQEANLYKLGKAMRNAAELLGKT